MEDNVTIEQRKKFILEMIPLITNDYIPIFIDETAININA